MLRSRTQGILTNGSHSGVCVRVLRRVVLTGIAKRPLSRVGPKLGAQCTASKTEYVFSMTLGFARFQSLPHGRGESQGTSVMSQYWIEVRSPLRPSTQRLSILLRHDGEIQILNITLP